MLAFYETASTQDEGHDFPFGFNEAAICVRETHMATKCRKPLETEECLWSEASRLCSPDATKELNFTAHLSLEVDSSPDKYQYENVQPSQHQDCNFETL